MELPLFSIRGTREFGANERAPPPRFHRSHSMRGHPRSVLRKHCHGAQEHVEQKFQGRPTMERHFSPLPLIIAAAFSLSACMSTADIAASDDAACRSAGAKPGTPAYVQCRENRSKQRA